MYKLSHLGNPHIGIFAKANNSVAFTACEISDKFERSLVEKLKVEVVKTTISNGNINGIYIALNSNYAVLPDILEKREIDIIKEHIDVLLLKEKNNAFGNNLSINDKGGVISESVSSTNRKLISDHLGIELVSMKIAQHKSVGSVLFCNNLGGVVCYSATDDEIKQIEEVMKVKLIKGSVNLGSKYISIGLIANDKGCIVGDTTSGVELARIEEGLDLIK